MTKFKRLTRRILRHLPLRINRQYKDRLFRYIFSNKGNLLSLYNAIHNTNYTDPDELIVTTIENSIYLGMKNDLSFLICNVMNIYEHQSTFNPNMPIRELIYLVDIYRKYIAEHNLNIYSSKLIKLPMPQCLVFYNGSDAHEDRQELKLSDSFSYAGTDIVSSLELTVIMLNINLGHNQELMDQCRLLKEYAQFIHQIRLELATGKVDIPFKKCTLSGNSEHLFPIIQCRHFRQGVHLL